MRLVMTLLVRDEADIVDAQLAFHLNAGVDFVIAMDHRSRDGTAEILRNYERDGSLRLLTETAPRIQQSEIVTRMARLATTEHGADWVINSDGDEFWWPRAQSLKEALSAVPALYGVVYGPMSYFLPRHGADPFYETMTVRLFQSAPINSPQSRYRPTLKAAHRANPRALVRRGNHDVEGAGAPLTAWHPFEVLHFPDRSPEQCARKYANTIAGWPSTGREPGAFVLAAQGVIDRLGAEAHFDRLAVSDERVTTDVGDGRVLETDTRLRDVLRVLRAPDGPGFVRRTTASSQLELPRPTLRDDARFAVDAAVLADAELIRLQRRIDDLGAKLRVFEEKL